MPINPKKAKPINKKQQEKEQKKGRHPAERRAKSTTKYVEGFPELIDFYSKYDPYKVTDEDLKAYEKIMEKLTDKEKSLLKDDHHYTLVEFQNHGGLATPILGVLSFSDGSTQEFRIPVDIWRRNTKTVSKLFITPDEVVLVTLDPKAETADTNTKNDQYPPEIPVKYFNLKKKTKTPKNQMQKAQDKEAKERQEQ